MLENINLNEYKYLFVSTTAKHNTPLVRLPDREVNNERSLNYLVNRKEFAIDLFSQVDGLIPRILIDVEAKQETDLYSIAKQYIKKSSVFPNKPNDLTLEAADILLQQHFNGNILGKRFLVIGTGNIAFKLALRLAERNSQVFVEGRNAEKVFKLVEAINLILPKYSEFTVKKFDNEDFEGSLDAVIPFISAEKVVDESYSSYLEDSSISIDGGIGNFTEGYITRALNKKSKVIRLDVRISLPFAEAALMTSSPSYSFFEEICGTRMIEDIDVVAGGIIGKAGAVIVDRIKHPSQVVGIANGYGGVKGEFELSAEERRRIGVLREQLE